MYALLALVALVAAPEAAADLADEEALANRHAPIVRLVEQLEECGPGEPFEPIDVDLLFDERTVALRGPWSPADLVEIGPTADDLVDLYEYHLDFPGDALDPGCDYERWARRLTAGRAPTIYAHVATDPARPGRLALQYWLFYPYNDWNNLHEGDWEMVQLVFDAGDAGEALTREPVAIGFSQHEGAERADWGDDKLELVDGRRPVVYPAAGSHANFFDAALYIGSSGEQGVGCDDTRGPHVDLDPTVHTIPSETPSARSAFPWIAFEGRWGELQKAFFNGPTGPNLKSQWTEPIRWSEGWRERSYAVPTGGLLGTRATDFFCTAVAAGSMGLIRWLQDPALVLLVLAGLLAVVSFAARRTTWRPAAPLRVARRRSWGQVLSAAARMYVDRAPLFLGIGLLLIPIALVTTLLQQFLFGGFGLLGIEAEGETAGALVLVLVVIGTTLTLLGLGLVQAATACALVEIDAGGSIGPIRAYRIALTRIRPLLAALGVAVGAWAALTATGFLIPVAVWLVVRWALLAQVVELENRSALHALRRSGELVRGRWLRVASLVGVGAVLALAAGPFLGALLILVTDAPPAALNLVAGIIYALAVPFVALTTSYVYFDARARRELEPVDEPRELPAERPARDRQDPVAHDGERRHRGHHGAVAHQTRHAHHGQGRGVGPGVDGVAQRRQPPAVEHDDGRDGRGERHDHRPDAAHRVERRRTPAIVGQEGRVEPGQHQLGHREIDQDHHQERQRRHARARQRMTLPAVVNLRRVERVRDRRTLADQQIVGGGVGGHVRIAVAFAGAARGRLRAREPPQTEAEGDEGGDDAQPGGGERGGAEVRPGNGVPDRRRSRQGGHREGRGAERDGGRHEAVRDVGRPEQGLRHRREHEERGEHAETAVGDERAGEHDREHGTPLAERVGHEPRDGRARAAVVHELAEQSAEEEQREEPRDEPSGRAHEGSRPVGEQRFSRPDRGDHCRRRREHQHAPATIGQPDEKPEAEQDAEQPHDVRRLAARR